MDISVRSEGPWLAEDRSWLASDHGTTATRSITLNIASFVANTHYPNGFIPSGMLLAQLASGLFAPYAGRAGETQTVTVTGAPTGGTFTLTFEGSTTAAIAYNATATAVKNALVNLPGITQNQVTVTGSAGGPYTVAFVGGLGGTDVPALTASGASLTGGTSPGVTIATTAAGGPAATDGSETPAGHLFNSIEVRAGQTANVGAPLLEHGFVRVSRLPANSGYDAYAASALTGKITYRP